MRKIAGLEAVDEAVGRATEMGRSCLFVPGIQDMNEIQTIAGITILARVAKTAAEYDAKVEVPTSPVAGHDHRPRDGAGGVPRGGPPDAYNEDLIYYVTDEQFGYVAYLSGMMVREKPAACFYMGAFFAESLILAETGNSIGAIQVAGTAQPAQLPVLRRRLRLHAHRRGVLRRLGLPLRRAGGARQPQGAGRRQGDRRRRAAGRRRPRHARHR